MDWMEYLELMDKTITEELKNEAEELYKELIQTRRIGVLEELINIFNSPERMIALREEVYGEWEHYCPECQESEE